MRELLAHHLHKDRVHHTALLACLAALAILGLDLALVQTAHAPTLLPASTIGPRVPGNSALATTSPVDVLLYPYIEVVASCGPYYQGTCVNMRSGPGVAYPVVTNLRTGIVLKVEKTVVDEAGRGWYKLTPDTGALRFPGRVTSDWYVAADVVQLFYDDGDHSLTAQNATSTKLIVVDRSEQMLYAYDGELLFMQQSISTGLELTPTPRGTFTIYKMTPSRYMQGPIAGLGDDYYDLPGVPWNLYFTKDGAVIHGAYWHDHFGRPWSHGCVNMPLNKAKELYLWAEVGTKVIVQE